MSWSATHTACCIRKIQAAGRASRGSSLSDCRRCSGSGCRSSRPAFLLSVFGAWLAYAIVHHDPRQIALFLPPQFRDSFDAWKQGFADHGDISAGEGINFSSQLMTHNTSVGIVAFATGITIVLPIYFMLSNGFVLGALIAVVQPTHHLASMWAGILPHGICELSAIFIDGGAGLCIGWALIAPGDYSRKDALVIAGRDACKMVVGTIPLFIIAGIIEGNVSHSSLPHFVKFTLAAAQFAALMFYIYGSRSPTPLGRSSDPAEQSHPAFSPSHRSA